MAMYAVSDESLSAIANAIRSKTGNDEQMPIAAMASAIEGISGGLSENMHDVSTDIQDVYIRTSDGKEIAYSGWSASAPIPVPPDATKAFCPFRPTYSIFYTESMEKIRNPTFSTDTRLADVPNGAKFYRLSALKKDMESDLMVVYFLK